MRCNTFNIVLQLLLLPPSHKTLAPPLAKREVKEMMDKLERDEECRNLEVVEERATQGRAAESRIAGLALMALLKMEVKVFISFEW